MSACYVFVSINTFINSKKNVNIKYLDDSLIKNVLIAVYNFIIVL